MDSSIKFSSGLFTTSFYNTWRGRNGNAVAPGLYNDTLDRSIINVLTSSISFSSASPFNDIEVEPIEIILTSVSIFNDTEVDPNSSIIMGSQSEDKTQTTLINLTN